MKIDTLEAIWAGFCLALGAGIGLTTSRLVTGTLKWLFVRPETRRKAR